MEVEDFKCPQLPTTSADENSSSTTADNGATTTKSVSVPPPPLSYTVPVWGCEPESGLGYKLEIVKNGAVVGLVDLDERKNGSYFVIGRLPSCDVALDHPSISRYHCVLQYGEDLMGKTGKGWHAYEMGSTHGSKKYVRLRVGFVMQFGGSTRIVCLTGPDEDAEEEWEHSPTEMKDIVAKKMLEKKMAKAAKKEFDEEKEREKLREDGCNWGMDYGEDDNEQAPVIKLDGQSTEDQEAYYADDPKKALAKFFEREGCDMTFEYSEQGSGHTHKWICSIELSIDVNGVDRLVTAQATVSTSKKDAQIQCSLEACRILDAHGVLRHSASRIRRKRKRLEDDDYYEEDDDLYLDRTGQVERQRDKRRLWAMEAAGMKPVEKTDTHESLCADLERANEAIVAVEKKLADLNGSATTSGEMDELLPHRDDTSTKAQKSILRQKLVSLTHDRQRLEQLCRITKPIAMPELTVVTAKGNVVGGSDKQAFLRKMMMIGRKPTTIENVTEKPVAQVTQVEEQVSKKSIENEVSNKAEISKAVTEKKENVKSVEEIVPETRLENETTPASSTTTTKRSVEHKVCDVREEKTLLKVVDNETKATKGITEALKTATKKPVKKVEPTAVQQEEKRAKEERQRLNRQREEQVDYGDDGADNDTYASWLPPCDQSGDGTTKLHEKFAGRY